MIFYDYLDSDMKLTEVCRAGYRTSGSLWHRPKCFGSTKYQNRPRLSVPSLGPQEVDHVIKIWWCCRWLAVMLHVIVACRKITFVVTRDVLWVCPQTGFRCICVVCSCVFSNWLKNATKKGLHFSKIVCDAIYAKKVLWPATWLIWWSTWPCMELI